MMFSRSAISWVSTRVRSEPSFEWVDVDWSAPEAAAERVLASVRKPRLEHEDDLAAPRQAEMRAVKPDEGKAMKRYVERHDALEDAAVCEALLREAGRELNATADFGGRAAVRTRQRWAFADAGENDEALFGGGSQQQGA